MLEIERTRVANGIRLSVVVFLMTAISSNLCAVPPVSELVISSGFILEAAPFAECHASTICETENGLAAAWFGGTEEGNLDVGIWLSRFESGKWSVPVEVANGIQFRGADQEVHRFACWNPVLVRDPSGRLHLFYKVGKSPSTWWGVVASSDDSGRTWSAPTRLPEGILGPIKNKGLWTNNELLCPSSTEGPEGWRVHFEQSEPPWTSWTKSMSIGGGEAGGGIQPTILRLPNGHLKAFCRCDGKAQRILESTSTDGGLHWSELSATALPNPNSGIDAVTMSDQKHILVYNHTTRNGVFPSSREMLNVAVSKDGQSWFAAAILDQDHGAEFSYPAVIQTRDGKVHITYTWNRKRIAHVVLEPAGLNLSVPITGLEWPQIR
jgi:predicted neuraminidase